MNTNWQTKKLGDLCAVISRGVSPKYITNSGIQVLNQKCIRNHEINYELSQRHDIDAKKVNEDKIIKLDDVLVNSTGTGTLGRVAQVRREPSEITTVDSHITIVRPQKNLFYNNFFGYALIKIEEDIQASGEGTSGQTELSRKTLEDNFFISYPESIEEQKRIVKILDEVFEGIEKAKENTKKNLQNSNELYKSILASEIDRIPTENKQKLNFFINRITYGFTNPMPTSEEGPYMVTAKDVVFGKVNYEGARRTTISAYQNLLTDKSRPETGDVLLTKDGTLGRVAVVTKTPLCINQSVALIQPDRDKIISEFLKYLLESPEYQKEMIDNAGGTTIKHIYITRVDKMEVSIPNLSKQIRIIKKLDILLAQTKKLEEIYKQKLALLEELKKSVLQKAFSGEL